jgi:hypothetical protein
MKPPPLVQKIFGILGGICADAVNVVHMRPIADELFGRDCYWSIEIDAMTRSKPAARKPSKIARRGQAGSEIAAQRAGS